MIIQGQVGPLTQTTGLSAGSQPVARLGSLGDLIMSELHGRYFETTYRRAGYVAANTAGVTTTVGTATTYVGLCLSNPTTSTFNLVVNKVGFAFLVANAAASTIGLMCGYSSTTNVTHTAAITARSAFIGQAAGNIATVDSSATLPTAPTVTHVLGSGLTGAITTVPMIAPTFVDLEGSLILMPGAYVAFHTSTASGASSFWGSFSWEEVPV